MESRIAVISIIVENSDSVECLNRILHEYGIYIIGRMGIPYRQRGISIISVAIDAPLDIINALTGKIGRLAGANVVMPNLSPVNVRDKYTLYDNKICTGDEAAECKACMAARMKSIGYEVVTDRGDYKA